MSDRDQEASSPRAEAIIIQQTDDDHHHHHHHHHAGELTDQDALSPPPPPPPPPPLEPFFTLVTNTTTGSTTHPRVRYLFSDDDHSSVLPPDPADHGSSSSSSSSPSRPLIVDLVPAPDNAGWSVSWASSLSPDFALTGSSITVQHEASHTTGDDRSATLRLEGVERDPPDASRPGSLPSSGSGSGTALGREDVDSLADDFRRRMGVLRKVVGESEKRRFVTEAQTGSPREREREREQHQGLQRQPQPEDDVAVEGESSGDKDAVRDSIRAEHAEAAGSTWG